MRVDQRAHLIGQIVDKSEMFVGRAIEQERRTASLIVVEVRTLRAISDQLGKSAREGARNLGRIDQILVLELFEPAKAVADYSSAVAGCSLSLAPAA